MFSLRSVSVCRQAVSPMLSAFGWKRSSKPTLWCNKSSCFDPLASVCRQRSSSFLVTFRMKQDRGRSALRFNLSCCPSSLVWRTARVEGACLLLSRPSAMYATCPMWLHKEACSLLYKSEPCPCVYFPSFAILCRLLTCSGIAQSKREVVVPLVVSPVPSTSPSVCMICLSHRHMFMEVRPSWSRAEARMCLSGFYGVSWRCHTIEVVAPPTSCVPSAGSV